MGLFVSNLQRCSEVFISLEREHLFTFLHLTSFSSRIIYTMPQSQEKNTTTTKKLRMSTHFASLQLWEY